MYEVILPHFAATCTIKQAVDDQARSNMSSEFETPQRSGTCYYKAVLAAIRFLADKVAGLSKSQRKQLMCALRMSYLTEIDDELDTVQRGTLLATHFVHSRSS